MQRNEISDISDWELKRGGHGTIQWTRDPEVAGWNAGWNAGSSSNRLPFLLGPRVKVRRTRDDQLRSWCMHAKLS